MIAYLSTLMEILKARCGIICQQAVNTGIQYRHIRVSTNLIKQISRRFQEGF